MQCNNITNNALVKGFKNNLRKSEKCFEHMLIKSCTSRIFHSTDGKNISNFVNIFVKLLKKAQIFVIINNILF